MTTGCRIADLQAFGRERIGNDEDARIDLRTLIEGIAGLDAARQFAFPEQEIPTEMCERLRAAIERRAAGEPVAYLLGYRDFWRHRFAVTPDTLIPRPETEQLVEWALESLSDRPARILDLGTGSGAIGLSLAAERPDCSVVAVDRSLPALQVAKRNQRSMDLTNVSMVQGDWAEAFAPDHFDLIVSNPPYICADDVHLRRGDLRFEPTSALAAGIGGLDDYRRLIPQSFLILRPGGMLLLEHGYDQAGPVGELMCAAGFVDVSMRSDLAGQPRNTAGRRPG